jgi:hypothetical protein
VAASAIGPEFPPCTPFYLSKEPSMQSLLLFFLGVPIPIIILIALMF